MPIRYRLFDLRQTRLPQAVGMALRDVFPVPSGNDERNGRSGYSQFFRNFFLAFSSRRARFPDVAHIRLSEFDSPIQGSDISRRPSFAHSVFIIVVNRACKVMQRVAASSIVALMKHAQSERNLTVRQQVSHPMRVVDFLVEYNGSIPVFSKFTFPRPAIFHIANFNLTPKDSRKHHTPIVPALLSSSRRLPWIASLRFSGSSGPAFRTKFCRRFTEGLFIHLNTIHNRLRMSTI